MSNNKSPTPAPYRIIGSYAGSPVVLRTYADRVELSFKGTNRSFPNRDAAMMYLQALCMKKRKGV